MLRVACPKCKKPLGLPDNVAGKSVKCPQCQQVFKAPAQPAAKPAGKPAVAGSANTHPDDQEATPYGLREDAPTPEQLRKSAQGEEVDQMVVDARRVKLRNKAWEKVGLPAKFVKRFALVACVFWLMTYLFLTMVIVLGNHNMEVAEKSGGQINTGGVKSLPKYLFVQDVISELNPQNVRPLFFWLVTGGLIVALCIYGLQLAGAEQMKKLTNYRLSMFAMVIGTLTLNLFCLLGLVALMDKQVQYEFRVTARRQAGVEGEAIYVEDEDEEEDEDDEDDEDEEEDEEEEEEAPRARKR